MPFEEKGSFVAKKEKPGGPDDPLAGEQGDNGGPGAFDPEHRLVVSVVPGKRTETHVRLLVQAFKERTGGRLLNRMTSDEYPAYRPALFAAYAVTRERPRTGRPGRPPKPEQVLRKKLT